MRFNDAVFGAVLIAFAAYVFIAASGFPTAAGVAYGPGFFPRLLACLLAVCGLGLVANGLRGLSAGGWVSLSPALREPQGWFGIAIVLGALLGYSWLDDVLGYHLTATLVVSGFMLFLRVRPLPALALGLAAAILTYLVFARFLLVPLPLGPLTGLI
ncbi:MAG: tripartite tricarboxylate transporter TctB family protein [Alphaproteobacteria bacterium]|nr:tripartite tricarboxylate transporter TctB family protein [Alphaproteobacteria bacterium]